MKFITNKYISYLLILIAFVQFFVVTDYENFVDNNVRKTVESIEYKLDSAKGTVGELQKIKEKNCDEMMLPLQKIVALNPMINSIAFIRDGQYYCSSIVGKKISSKVPPKKEIHIHEKNKLTGMPSFSYYHQYNDDHGIQFYMKGISVDLGDSPVGHLSLSNKEYVISKDNVFSVYVPNEKQTHQSDKYDFVILLDYNAGLSIKNYLLSHILTIIIVILLLILIKVISFKVSLLDFERVKIKKAIKNNRVVPFIQPIVDADENIIGGEILARWVTSSGEIIPPLSFIPKIEKFGLINAMTKSLLNQLKGYVNEQYVHRLKVSVNFTESCLYDEEMYELCKELSGHFILILEFTESMEFADKNKIISYMEKFRKIGVQFSLDDYGTGYSSLKYLNYYQFDVIKIDKSFIDDIETNQHSIKIIENIILLANNLNIQLVAEGVENHRQKKILNDLNISAQQGFYYFKPMPLDNFHSIMNS
ncbi:EAL domain-containing protein [Aliivibrio fischeri]|uniref:EAL domain-containing protein n=1 Tax=Aliivibrio fischeri TaxID=668 RepID=UPI0012D9C0CA|nr:EAL domain-containing protein [Aliivibrio fischeri]MUK62044.1 EAL domain-containing protein [Aliivibrio fischeri]MUL21684.1 EAL domain-containing protein [Aliivibrio fischeri]MUL26327.1 EAL domain-containing protein [Aliivibrio fischeri]